jgi:hypothetical protein
MIKKLLRFVLSLVGVLFGYGVFLLFRALLKDTGLADKILAAETQQMIAGISCALIFGLIFYLITRCWDVTDKGSRKTLKRIYRRCLQTIW